MSCEFQWGSITIFYPVMMLICIVTTANKWSHSKNSFTGKLLDFIFNKTGCCLLCACSQTSQQLSWRCASQFEADSLCRPWRCYSGCRPGSLSPLQIMVSRWTGSWRRTPLCPLTALSRTLTWEIVPGPDSISETYCSLFCRPGMPSVPFQ